MKKYTLSVICFFSFLFITVVVHGQGFNGPGVDNNRQGRPVMVNAPIPVSEARNLPHDSWVIATGNIINSVGKEYYTFRDSSGEISVEIEREVWRGLSVGVSDRVEIHGELKIKRGLNAGEKVVVQGQQFLTDGAAVRLLGNRN